jgi:hypothetical protein
MAAANGHLVDIPQHIEKHGLAIWANGQIGPGTLVGIYADSLQLTAGLADIPRIWFSRISRNSCSIAWGKKPEGNDGNQNFDNV